jgi:thioredoxin-dependent peroxiredoxin
VEAIPAARLLEDADLLRASIVRGTGGSTMTEADFDVRPAASRWTRQYAAALWPSVLVALAHGIGLDASIERCTVVMRGHLPGGLHLADDLETVRSFRGRCSDVPTGGAEVGSVEELRAYVLERVVTRHLVPLYARVHDLVKVSPELMWSNVAEHADLVCEAAESRLDTEAARPYAEESRALLQADTLPGVPGANPLKGWMLRDAVDESDFPRPMPLRHVCCVHYLLPDRVGRFCSNCPLITTEERVAMARSARGGHSLPTVSRAEKAPAQSETGVYLQPGQSAPPFTLPSTSGEPVSLEEYRGRKPVVLLFYTKDDLPASVAEFVAFRDRFASFQERGIEVLGINADSLDDHARFRERYGLPFQLLTDADHAVSRAYGAWQVTSFRGKDVSNVVHTSYVVDTDGVVRALYTHVRGEQHAEQVLNALEDVLAVRS